MKFTKILAIVLLFVSTICSAQFSFKNYALHHLNVVDVNTKQILKNHSIVIHDGTIINILPTSDYINNDSTQVILLKNKYVVPGLIDAHVHFATDPTKERRDNAEKVLKEMLLTGVTSVRDMAGDTRALASLSRNTLVGDVDGPTIYYSALMAGTRFFSDPRTIATAQGGVSGEMPYMKAIHSGSNLPLEIAQAKGTGAHGIKLYANLSAKEMNAIVKEAKKQGIPVWSHVSLKPTKPSEVIASEVISISHVSLFLDEKYTADKKLMNKWSTYKGGKDSKNFWDKEFQKLDFSKVYESMKKNNVVLDATVTVLEIYKKYPKHVWRYELGKRITADAYKNGVHIAAGSDSDQKTFVQHEMKLLVKECGLSPFDALISATKYSAMATGIFNTEGSIEKGKKANLLFLNKNPTTDVKNINDVYLVIKNGKLYNSK